MPWIKLKERKPENPGLLYHCLIGIIDEGTIADYYIEELEVTDDFGFKRPDWYNSQLPTGVVVLYWTDNIKFLLPESLQINKSDSAEAKPSTADSSVVSEVLDTVGDVIGSFLD